MTLSTLIQQLDTLGFGGFKAALQRQSEDANYAQLPFEERLFQLLEAEQSERTDKKIKRLLSQAKLKDRQASLDAVEYSAKRGMERSQILSLASGEYISKGQNILITGAIGVGKSFLAQALASRRSLKGTVRNTTESPDCLKKSRSQD